MIRVIDLETTGVDPINDAVVEIASVDVKRNSAEEPKSTFVNPGRPIPAEASAIHHIIDADVANAPIFERAIEEFRGADIYVAHNAQFEKAFLDARKINFGDQWICTYKCALRTWPALANHTNQALRYHFKMINVLGVAREELSPHRALSDCYVTAGIFLLLIKEKPWKQLLEWSQEPALHVTLKGGKHHGKRYAEVAVEDPAYLDWMLRAPDMSPDKKFSAAYWLDEVRKERRA